MEWLGLGVPREGLGVPREWLGLGVRGFWSAGVEERLICDMFGLMSGPFAGSGAGDIGTLVSKKKYILLFRLYQQ